MEIYKRAPRLMRQRVALSSAARAPAPSGGFIFLDHINKNSDEGVL